MNGIEYFADTNSFIYLLDAHPMLLQFAASRWIYSYITEMELLSKKGLTPDHENIIRKMLNTCTKYGHSETITELTVNLRRKYCDLSAITQNLLFSSCLARKCLL